MNHPSRILSRIITDLIELLNRFRSVSNLSRLLIALMAFPSNIPLAFSLESASGTRGSTFEIRTSPTLVRKHDRVALIGWADDSGVADNAEETDHTLPAPSMLAEVSGPSPRIPSTIHGPGTRHFDAGRVELRNSPLRC